MDIKKGPKKLAENYRPIGLTSIVCKMDKFIRDCILDHMERHNLFTTHQHGFRKGRYCVTQLIEVQDDWTGKLDNKMQYIANWSIIFHFIVYWLVSFDFEQLHKIFPYVL
jgi:hypothetical protein